MPNYLLDFTNPALKHNIDPRASLFVIFVLLVYITVHDRLVKVQKRDKL
jgi:hypothetical protein